MGAGSVSLQCRCSGECARGCNLASCETGFVESGDSRLLGTEKIAEDEGVAPRHGRVSSLPLTVIVNAGALVQPLIVCGSILLHVLTARFRYFLLTANCPLWQIAPNNRGNYCGNNKVHVFQNGRKRTPTKTYTRL